MGPSRGWKEINLRSCHEGRRENRNPQNRRPPRLTGCFAPRVELPFNRASRFFRSSSLSSSSLESETCALLAFLGSGGDEEKMRTIGRDGRREKVRQASGKPRSSGKGVAQVREGSERIGKGVGERRGRMSSHMPDEILTCHPTPVKPGPASIVGSFF